MARLLTFLILIVDVIAILDILRSGMDKEKKVLWIVAVVFLPIIGPVFYYLISRNIIRL